TPAVVAQHLPSGPLIITAWIAGALIAYAGALTFAELGTRFPEAGGHYVYLRNAFGKLPAFLYGWMLLLIIATGALASLALAFAHYVSAFIPMSDVVQRLLGAATIVVLSIINILGVKPGARTTTALTVIKVAGLGTLIVAGLLVPYNPAPFPLVQCDSIVKGFIAALVPISFSYGGWQQLNFVAGEIKDTQRKIPAALALGVGIVALIYVGANFVYLRALGAGGMANSTAIAQAAAQNLFGGTATRLITVLITISILAFSNVVVMVTPRVFYALGQDGVFLRGLSALHPKYNTPVRAFVLQGGWAVVLVMIGNIGMLMNGVVFGDWIFFGLGAASLFVFRRRTQPDDVVPFKTPGYPIVPIFFILAAIMAVASAIGSYPKESLLGLAMLGVGVLVYKFTQSRG
ncbi:MAG TPA: amino acid permease, partial [Longimicrobiales bacterium]|nr:amino acid permease [Longimicrobiales bacterium]